MESLPFTQFLSLPRWHYSPLKSPELVRFQDSNRLKSKWVIAAISRKKVVQDLGQDGASDNEAVVKKTTRIAKRTATRVRKKKASKDVPAENSELEVTNYAMDEESTVSTSTEDSKKTPRRRRKAASASAVVEEEKTENTGRTRRKTRKKDQVVDDQASELEISDQEESSFIKNVEDDDDDDLELEMHKVEDISFTYGWPPLVCCFGAAQHAFVPSGRPANRLIDYEIHERMKDALWSPDSFVRAPGGSASTVAIALASLGGKVAFLGKLGDDDYGRAMLYYMNVNNVQTRSVCIDSRRTTAISHMKLAKRGSLRATCIKTCVEDSLSKSDINVDVLKEAKMFYFSTHSLLDQNMRSTTLRAIRISKELGGVIFYDVNLPLPLWQSSEETKMFTQKVWNLANIIEVTKQELEFLCGIEPVEEFDTKTNARSKFVHYEPEVVAPLWHENLKVLIVTNGTSKIHYYTEEHNGAVHGMEDAPITPLTADMSASGDGIVAGLMRMLALQLHRITDKEYLEQTIKYAINCGVIDQWLLGRERGFPPREDTEEEVKPDPNGIRSITEKEYRTVGALDPVS